MPRNLSLSNGRLLVNFDCEYCLRDLHWPHVGQENHTAGHPFRFGLFVDGRFSWISDPQWEKHICYSEDTLTSHVTIRNRNLRITLVCYDAVDFHEDLFLRLVEVHDDRSDAQSDGGAREVRLFFCQDFHIYGIDLGDTAYYEPERHAVFHYKGMRWFMIDTGCESGDEWRYGVDQWAVGKKETDGKEGAWRDAEDGVLSGNAVAQGSVDSVVALHVNVAPGGCALGCYWIAVGGDFEKVTAVSRAVRRKTPTAFLDRTRSYWRLWVRKKKAEEAQLPEAFTSLYRRSLLIVRAHIDDAGGVVAATDFDTADFARDTYAYVWPRDGALAVAALINAGYSHAPGAFFNFCHSVITTEGYMLHKFNPDRSLASTWHGWSYQGKKILPIQEDETALVLWALRLHFERFHDVEFIKPLYRGLVVRAANWMADYVDAEGLCLPSWDLWEERYGVHAWTVGAVWAGFQAAARFADDFGEEDLATRYRETADRVKTAATRRLWDNENGRFVRTATFGNGDPVWDKTLDASLSGLWCFGMLDAADERIVATMDAVRRRLWVQSPVGGLARYENDYYYQVSPDKDHIAGNPWFVCSLWLAQWYIRRAAKSADLESAAEIMKWAVSNTLPNGLMAEQVHPFTHEPLSACPLTWSHAAFVQTVQEYVAKCCELRVGPHHLQN
jgi:GH15 family glucan-1,4-alpha-glucosidase